ncbi:MAG: putative phosphothreonine lyase domain-containing protein [Verrucomicrobiia bacterium]|jgi:hypothetical protein
MKTQRDSKPSNDKRGHWLFAKRKLGSYPEHTDRGGKWLIFVPSDAVDEVWQKIKLAVEEGKLGSAAKVSTAKPNPNSTDSSKHVICVYTYDATDETDVRQIRSSLRDLGITSKIPYKTDDATLRGKYRKSGDKRISLYYE